MHPFLRIAKIVFSAHAEVVPGRRCWWRWATSILRARGGSSARVIATTLTALYSPRTRR